MLPISLQDFLKPTPVCAHTDSVGIVLERFRQEQCEQIIILDQQHIPLGLITLRSIAPYFMDDRLSSLDLQSSILNLQRSQTAQIHSILYKFPLIEPIVALSSAWGFRELQQYTERPDVPVVLVDSASRFLGLLDMPAIWQFLARNPYLFSPSVLDSSVGVRSSAWSDNPAAAAADLLPLNALSLRPFLDILQHLPLPLMLQTGSGQVVTQNSAWQQQLGDLKDPVGVRQAAALFLERINAEQVPSHDMAGFPYGEHEHWHPAETLASGDWEVIQAQTVSELTQSAGMCRIGVDGNTCDCVCSMKSGMERVWRFIKIPLGTLSADFSASITSPASLSAEPMLQLVGTATPDASEFHLAELGDTPNAFYLPEAQSETLWLVLAQDTTEQYQTDRELAAKNADLVQLNRLKDEFLACISHELKTPLTAILGLSTLLKDRSIGELNQRQARYAQLIYQSGRHLMLIVNDMLDLARIETSQLDLLLEPVNIATVCDRAYSQACQQAGPPTDGAGSDAASASDSPTLPFQLDIQSGLELTVADEMRLRQMLTNLLSNAIKFTPPEGAIGLQVERWANWLAFTVWDTGIGIPSEKQHLIFQKFQQLESPLTRSFEGTGLGLVLTQRLARLHGGDVTFTSIEGQGSRFTILLPPVPPQASHTLAPDQLKLFQTPIAVSNRLVLIMEVTPTLIEGLTTQLTSLGYKVAIARSGTEALEKARRLQPSAIFLNPLLPMLSGWDVLTLLKSDAETRHIPIVVTTGHAERYKVQHSGADHLLSLPSSTEELVQTIDRLIPPADRAFQSKTASKLTILYLRLNAESDLFNLPAEALPDYPQGIPDLHSLLAPYRCRVLEVDDLEQADLLARVWKPHAVLIGEVATVDRVSYFQQLSRYAGLQALPLVTLTPEITQAANQVSRLRVFPCLLSLTAIADPEQSSASALLQVIQVAAGLDCLPHVLLIDLVAHPNDAPMQANPVETLIHYIQGIGLQSVVASSAAEVVQQFQQHSVDLILLRTHSLDAHPALMQIVQMFEELDIRPPVLLWLCQLATETAPKVGHSEAQAFARRIEAIATHILPASTSIEELIHYIDQTLGRGLRG